MSTNTTPKRVKKYFSKYKKPLTALPHLVENQTNSYKWLIEKGLADIFKEFSPIKDYSEKKFALEFTSFELSAPKYNEYFAKENKLTYEAPLRAKIKLTNRILGTSKEQEIFIADFPLMTGHGTFVINGVERVVVPQLARSFGVFFDSDEIKGRKYFGGKIIPARGVWVEINAEADNLIHVRIDKKRKFGIVSLLRVFGMGTDEQILASFSNEKTRKVIAECLASEPTKTLSDSYIDIYKRLRDGDLANPENAKEYIDALFSETRYDFSLVGRHRFNKRRSRRYCGQYCRIELKSKCNT
jgi:DNA-directed RNA polymerase subunit beta